MLVQVMWDMGGRPSGNCFYECLQAEVRGIVTMPDAIRTKGDFEDWTMGERIDLSIVSEDWMMKIESLFTKSKIQLVINSKTTLTGNRGRRRSIASDHRIQMKFKDGVYSSSRRLSNTSSSLHGIESVDFWLRNLAVHLNASKSESSSVLFIVGTHLDRAGGLSGIRHERVMEAVRRVGIKVPVFVNEISIYPMDGVDELMPGVTKLKDALYESIRGLPHMGEKVPKSYMQVLSQIQSLSEERRAKNQSKCNII